MKTGHSKLDDYFVSSRAKGREGLPLMSVTLNNGLVVRDSLERRTTTSLDPKEHLLVKEGDIAYNMMRVWQGALGRASSEGLVSPAYVVLRPRDGVDSKYAEYLFKTPRMIYLFWAYSYGLTKDRLRLYPNDFKKIPAKLPSYRVQTKVSEILSTWDKAIEIAGRLVEEGKSRKRSLVQKLMSKKVRGEGFDGVWVKEPMRNLAYLSEKKRDPKNPKSLPDKTECIELEHIDQRTGVLLGSYFTDRSMSQKNFFSTGDVLFGKLRPYLRKYWLSDRSAVCSSEIWVIKPNKEKVCSEYLFLLVQLDKFIESANKSTGTHMPRADWKVARDTVFEIPGDIEEQMYIARVIKSADEEVEVFQKRLDCLRQEKRALMQQLLTGKRRIKVEEEAVA